MDQSYTNSDYLSHLQQLGGAGDAAGLDYNKSAVSIAQAANNLNKLSKSNQQALQQQQQQQQHQITAAIIQQQNRALAQQSLEKFGNLTAMEKQRILQQLDKKHYETVAAVAQANNLNLAAQTSMLNTRTTNHSISQLTSHHTPPTVPPPIHHHAAAAQPIPIPPSIENSHKSSEYSRAMYDDGLESYSAAHYSTSNRELLALHNGAWSNSSSTSNLAAEARDGMIVGQDKIIRAFSELMKNMARMKTFIRPVSNFFDL
jgi:hypothetical protein